jgi:hypothetical protein
MYWRLLSARMNEKDNAYALAALKRKRGEMLG